MSSPDSPDSGPGARAVECPQCGCLRDELGMKPAIRQGRDAHSEAGAWTVDVGYECERCHHHFGFEVFTGIPFDGYSMSDYGAAMTCGTCGNTTRDRAEVANRYCSHCDRYLRPRS